jgi:hypothetical protein
MLAGRPLELVVVAVFASSPAEIIPEPSLLLILPFYGL